MKKKKKDSLLSRLFRKPKKPKRAHQPTAKLSKIDDSQNRNISTMGYISLVESPQAIAERALERLEQLVEQNVSTNLKSREVLARAQALNEMFH